MTTRVLNRGAWLAYGVGLAVAELIRAGYQWVTHYDPDAQEREYKARYAREWTDGQQIPPRRRP